MLDHALTLQRLLRDHRKPRAELDVLASAKLRRVLRNAMSVPYYRDIMRAAGYDPMRDFGGPGDLSLFPPLRKTSIKSSPESFVRQADTDRLEAFFRDHTSGSTGTPMSVYRTRRERQPSRPPRRGRGNRTPAVP